MKCTETNRFLFPVFLLLIMLIESESVYSQVFYANTATTINEVIMTSSGCIEKKSKFACPQVRDSIFSIAYFRDTMYIVTSSKNLYYTTGDQPGSCVLLSPFTFVTSLVAAPDGTLYGANGGSITYFDPHTKQRVDYDPMPFNSTGDLIFHNNKLYMAADSNIIVEVNLTTPALSKKVMDLSVAPTFGLASNPGPCGNAYVYALSETLSGFAVTAIDLDNAQELGRACVLKSNYLDAASPDEQPAVAIDSINIIPECGSNTITSTLHIVAHGASGTTLTYNLSNGDNNTTGIFPGLRLGSFAVHVSSSTTCFTDSTFDLYKVSCNKVLVVPNAFTPNHDGINDILRPLGVIHIGHINFSIYNRYGQKIFESKDFSHGWDGTFHGEDQPTGTFVWVLTYINDSGATVTAKGTTVLIR